MRTLERNKTTLYHAEYVSEAETTRNGLKTGHYESTYTTPVKERMNISPARGSAVSEEFGINTDYTKTAVTSNMNCTMDENSIVWIGVEPSSTVDNHNYVVVRKAQSLNSITYALREVANG